MVSVIGKDMGTKEVLHLINFKNATSLLWRDADGTQPAPDIIQNTNLSFTTTKSVKTVWYASPDINFGAPQQINFNQSGNTISFTLPSLQYWDMIVVEYN
jgi:dextranase